MTKALKTKLTGAVAVVGLSAGLLLTNLTAAEADGSSGDIKLYARTGEHVATASRAWRDAGNGYSDISWKVTERVSTVDKDGRVHHGAVRLLVDGSEQWAKRDKGSVKAKGLRFKGCLDDLGNCGEWT